MLSFYFFKCCTSYDNLPTSPVRGGYKGGRREIPAALNTFSYSRFISSGSTGSKATPYQWSGS